MFFTFFYMVSCYKQLYFKSFSIEEQLGFALGVVGLRLNDFCHLTPNEWQAVAEAHTTHAENHLHDEWERMRLLATISIQPHVKNKVTPTRLLPLPWDSIAQQPHETALAPQLSKEEARARFVALVKRERSEQKLN